MIVIKCNSCGRWIGKEEMLGTVMEGICSIECCPECKCTEALMDVDYGCNFDDTELEKLWNLFGEVSVNDDDETEEEFLKFPEGTDRLEIWHWFDELYSKGVSELMNCEG